MRTTALGMLVAGAAVGLLVAGCKAEPSPDSGGATGTDSGAAATDSSVGTDAAPADTWTNFAMGFMDAYCNSCHSPGGTGYRSGELDFRMYDLVVLNAAEIRCGTANTRPADCVGFPPPMQFPIACPCPTPPERDRLVAWIEAGAPL